MPAVSQAMINEYILPLGSGHSPRSKGSNMSTRCKPSLAAKHHKDFEPSTLTKECIFFKRWLQPGSCCKSQRCLQIRWDRASDFAVALVLQESLSWNNVNNVKGCSKRASWTGCRKTPPKRHGCQNGPIRGRVAQRSPGSSAAPPGKAIAAMPKKVRVWEC